MKAKHVKEKLFYLGAVGMSIIVLIFFIGSVWIGHEAKSMCQNAQWQYGNDLPADQADCVEALIAQLNDEHQGYRARNHAIWALGQLGDERALPALKQHYNGNIPDREPLHETISQYELKKAIHLVSGGTNISSFIWRSFISN